jgi:hypothetical protein
MTPVYGWPVLGKLECMGNRVILWGLWFCLVLLAIEISLLAATRNWLALSVTLAGLGGVVAATYLKGRPKERRR